MAKLLDIIFPWASLSRLRKENEELQAKLTRLTDRDERGHFVRR